MSKIYFLSTVRNLLRSLTVYSIGEAFIKIVHLLIGFFIATIITTIVSQTGDWGIVAGAVTVTYIELIGKYLCAICFKRLNSLRIGIVYGLFVDALCDLLLKKF
nr:conserved hypothetical plastid protein [Bangiopsis subsimplex]